MGMAAEKIGQSLCTKSSKIKNRINLIRFRLKAYIYTYIFCPVRHCQCQKIKSVRNIISNQHLNLIVIA